MATDTKTNEITNQEDYIDTRDILERIADLGAREARGEELDVDAPAEMEALCLLVATMRDNNPSALDDGVTLIRESAFEDHARELAEDIGAIGRDAMWPVNHIDWDAACDALKMNYTEVDFDGVTYWYR